MEFAVMGTYLAAVQLTTDTIKYTTTYARPYFLNSCFGSAIPLDISTLTIADCTTTDDIVWDWASGMPSGHTSMSCSIAFMVLLTMRHLLFSKYGKSLTNDTAKKVAGGLYAVIFIGAVTAAIYISVTRVTYNYHTTEQVLSGLGISAALGLGIFYMLQVWYSHQTLAAFSNYTGNGSGFFEVPESV
jgi:membrane-associated phospholipid phosphatase